MYPVPTPLGGIGGHRAFECDRTALTVNVRRVDAEGGVAA